MLSHLSAVSQKIAACYAELAQVEAVALGGSAAAGEADEASDIDLYLYVREEPPLGERRRIAEGRGERVELDNRFWEPGDAWDERESGLHVDVMYRRTGWIEDELDRVLCRHEASLGYTTCLWHNVRTSLALSDREGWLARLQERAAQPYPEALRRAIVAKNHAVLRRSAGSYLEQLRAATERNDAVSVHHRVAALLASYFDILFALNRQTHPGEKRLLERALERCQQRPARMADQVLALLAASAGADAEALSAAEALIDGMHALLSDEGLAPA